MLLRIEVEIHDGSSTAIRDGVFAAQADVESAVDGVLTEHFDGAGHDVRWRHVTYGLFHGAVG